MIVLILTACGVNAAQRNNRGNALADDGRYDEAVIALQAAQVAAPDRPEPYYNAGRALTQAGRYDEAIAAFEQALKTADEDLAIRIYYNLGNALLEALRCDEAAKAYQEVLLRTPDDEDALHNLQLTALCFTPTPIEQQTEPEEDDADPEATPTDNPGDFDNPTPTPPPPEQAPPDPSATPIDGDTGDGGVPNTPTPMVEGRITLEEAERLLDALQQEQQTLREVLETETEPNPQTSQDW
ncbi:MAG: hypothetical protein CUN54_07685 [Phototrophicales bacterium]|nr:MAG: hypothetical protein CUN54_07685 [Phototrophicales bacterium]